MAASLWLVIAPLLTNCLYHGWLVKPASIFTRWKRELILSDIVAGLVLSAIIIISFLSLMSFADFLRVHWQQAPLRQDEAEQVPQQRQRQPHRRGEGNDDDPQVEEENDNDGNLAGVDRGIVEYLEHNAPPEVEEDEAILPPDDDAGSGAPNFGAVAKTGHDTSIADSGRAVTGSDVPGDELLKTTEDGDPMRDELGNQAARLRALAEEREARNRKNERTVDNSVAASDTQPQPNNGGDGDDRPLERRPPDENGEGGQRIGNESEGGDGADDASKNSSADEPPPFVEPGGPVFDDDDDDDSTNSNENVANDEEDLNGDDDGVAPRLDDGAPPFDPMDPILQDDQVDMEINVALDELLGLRGPLSLLVRNLLWLLAFNATYLGIFGFIPKTVGYVVYSGFLNTTACETVIKSIPYVYSENENRTTVLGMLSKLEEESQTKQTTFKLSDFAMVTLGYLSIAALIVILRYGLIFFQKAGQRFGLNSYARLAAHRENEGMRPMRRVDGGNVNDMGAVGQEAVDEDGLGNSLGMALDATVAIVKVGVLLFLKMFLLPLSLGLWLDASTVHLFGHDAASRLAFAGGDLFSFVLLHWVAGITFMLLVTVFLLQLREVTHPDLLARLIRPQEPQPDLLGNLMHETVLTHIKRMALSLAIYAPLLTLYVTLPAQAFVASGLDRHFTFFHLKFYYLVMPQLQIPIELIIFHLSMLALLERYKNTIGGLQHNWLKFICRQMGLSEYILPRSIKSFELVGSKAVFLPTDNGASASLKVDPFFSELATKKGDIDSFVLSNIDKEHDPFIHGEVRGATKASGERVLSNDVDSISIPVNAEEKKLLSTKIGRYRLRLEEWCLPCPPEDLRIEFFREVQGDEIPRPPEGWDDLGQGGAFVQGRWAWANERKSVVEGGVAHRTPFRTSLDRRRPAKLVAKVVALILVSWVAVTVTALIFLSLPLAIGRSFYQLFRIPHKYIHDPLAFCIGAGLFFPTVSMVLKAFEHTDIGVGGKARQWLSHFRLPRRNKLLVMGESVFLWLLAAPFMFGVTYEIGIVKSAQWFAGREPLVEWKTLATSWIMGIVVLNTWAFLLYFEFFTRQFWANVGNGILEPPIDEIGNNNNNVNLGDNNGMVQDQGAVDPYNANEAGNLNPVAWQGKQGRVANFFQIWKPMIADWEWDLVDRTTLLDEFTRPITKQLASALLGSILSFQFVHYVVMTVFTVQTDGIVFPLLGLVEKGVVNRALFRCCTMLHVLVQIASSFRDSIDGWFEVAHEAARDDRYLIGELLIDYDQEEQMR